MLLSELEKEQLLALPPEQKNAVVFDRGEDADAAAPVALLLGGKPENMDIRVRAAAQLYREGRVQKILPSGAMCEVTTQALGITEGEYMLQKLLALGIPREDIIPETQARTTVENMLLAQLEINRHFGNRAIRDVIVVTSRFHLFRSKCLAELYLPRTCRVFGVGAEDPVCSRDTWQEREDSTAMLNKELVLIWRMTQTGTAPDMTL